MCELVRGGTMFKFLSKEYSRRDLQRYFGSGRGLYGIRRFRYDEGKAQAMACIEVKTGSGFRFVVLPDRGLDIGLCEYQGMPISFGAPVGEVNPAFYEPEGDGWFRTFGGGLLATCGLTYLGAPDMDQGESLGLHGRIHNTPGEEVGVSETWEDDLGTLRVTGKVRQAKTLGENVVLERQIQAYVGENKVMIKDRVTNEGFSQIPHMQLYHFNIGHPILDEGTKLITNSTKVWPRDDVAAKEGDQYYLYKGPTPGYPDTVFYHRLAEDKDGYCRAALINPRIKLGVYVKYLAANLPNFVQWKYTAEGCYAAGLEPANSWVEGRSVARKRGELKYLAAGESKEYQLEVGLLTNEEEINQLVEVTKHGGN